MRGKRSTRREVKADPIYKSALVTRLIHKVMQSGKKITARNIVYTAIGGLDEDNDKALERFKEAMKNITPSKEIRSRRIGGATYQVPHPVNQWRAEALAIRWLVEAARSKSGKRMDEHLLEELQAALEGAGAAVKKKEEVHRMAEANRAFAHFAN